MHTHFHTCDYIPTPVREAKMIKDFYWLLLIQSSTSISNLRISSLIIGYLN